MSSEIKESKKKWGNKKKRKIGKYEERNRERKSQKIKERMKK